MSRRAHLAIAAGLVILLNLPAFAQQQATPSINAQPLPPLTQPAPDEPGPAPQLMPMPVPMPPAAAPVQPAPGQPAPAPGPQAGRVFCGQTVTVHTSDPRSVAEPYRQFVGIFSDAAWNAQLCAALVVETIGGDGTATITYAFGPLDSGSKTAGGVLHGTGIVKGGVLLFQNSDGSQYVFQPFYSDLSGKWTTPQGQTYEAIFKRAF